MKKLSKRFVIFLILIFTLAGSANAASTLIPGGQIIGLELQDSTVTVAAIDESLGSAAKAAGLKEGDKILRINNKVISCAQDVRHALVGTNGKVKVTVSRDGKSKTLSLSPCLTDDGPRLGVYLRQGTTGVGTITYYNPETGDFAALGHGVNVSDGKLLKLTKGTAYAAQINTVKKGKIGKPGQLMGVLSAATPFGTIEKNTNQGVFGNLDTPIRGDALPVADPADVQVGPATIRSTVSGNCLQEYSVKILKIYPNAQDRCRNMLIKITDPQLLETTGGIVQGMSGSPIIQDGKLVGAVPHVLVNDPTMGYGIFIENMLDAAA